MTSKPKSFFKIASEIHRHVSYRYKLAMILTGSKARLSLRRPILSCRASISLLDLRRRSFGLPSD